MTPFCGSLLLLLLLLAPVPSPAQDLEAEGERPWDGFLPDPDQEVGDAEEPGSDWLGVRVLDAATGLPVPGARWVRTPEWIQGNRRKHDAVMGVALTDAEGIARMENLPWAWSDDCHWLVLADGYAPAYDYGTIPETEVLLESGRPLEGVLLDNLGRPVAGGVVEYVGGCSHGTAALRAVTGSDGSFTLGPHLCGGGQYWIEGPGIASDLVAADSPPSFGSRPTVIVGEPGLRYEGRVVDLLGRPVADCVVRARNEQRGPATATDEDGRFVLDGVEPDSGLVFFPASDLTTDESDWYVHDAHPGIPVTVTLCSLGIVEEEETAEVVVAARTAEGSPVPGVPFLLAGIGTGRGPDDETGEEPEDAPPGGCLLEVVPGRYRVLPASPTASITFEPAEVTAVEGGTAEVVVTVRVRPRLRIRGTVPEGASLLLGIPGAECDEEGEDASWSPFLSAGGPAVLSVSLEGSPTFFFPVGPEKGGFREATVSIPPPRRIVLPKGARDGELAVGDREVAFREGADRTLETWAEGRVTLRFRDGMKTWRTMEVDLPPLDGGVLEVLPTEGETLPGERSIRLLARGEDGEWLEVDEEEAYPGETVVFEEEGMQTLRCLVSADGPLDVRRGDCRIALRILDDGGGFADALVSVDGEIHRAPGGRLSLGGLDPGPHRLLVALRDEVGGGRELRFALTDGEEWQRTVALGE